MHPPSPLKFLRYPITTIIILVAIVATVLTRFGANIDPVFLSNTGNCLRESWRLFTPAVFHGGPLHLIFNICWLWAFGTIIESRFGHVAMLGICFLLAVGSVAAELALFRCGLGLSGVVYGLFGLLWVLSETDPRFEDAVDEKIVELMIGWFILCIVLKVAEVWNIALVSHAAGCILGALLGWTLTADQIGHRIGRSSILAATMMLILIGATIAREKVNLVHDLAPIYAEDARNAWEHGDAKAAIENYLKATDANPNVYIWWTNLGLAYQKAGRDFEAREAYKKADNLKQHPVRPESRPGEQLSLDQPTQPQR